MIRKSQYFSNLYRDSVALMQLSAALLDVEGVVQASLVMATEANIDLLAEVGLVDAETAPRPNDILFAIEAEDDAAHAAALAAAEGMLAEDKPAPGGGGVPEFPPRSFEMALEAMPAANLALISCPGEYAAAEGMKALRLGLDVMIFSDNVRVEDEVRLKSLADATDHIVMGPDCGTSIIGGVPLGFANVVARGDIGIVAASGTGLQQVSCLIDQAGAGVSHALGTGGRDLAAAVGGVSMLRGLRMLAEDASTKVIVLISKPPADAVAEAVLEAAAGAGKPAVVNFLGMPAPENHAANLVFAANLEDAASAAVALSQGSAHSPAAASAVPAVSLAPQQKFIRGLYSGGTFCYEAQQIFADSLGPVYSTTPLLPDLALTDHWQSQEHTIIDLGDDVFTRGRPHPMIDHRLRNERFLQEAADTEVALILLDVVLGYGAHMDPAGEMIPALREAQSIADAAGRALIFVGFICGTAADPQDMAAQQAALVSEGVILASSNAAAVRLSAQILGKE